MWPGSWRILPLILICGCCSTEETYHDPPPPPLNPSLISAKTKALGPANFDPTIELNGGQLNVIVRLTYPNPRVFHWDLQMPSVVELELLDSRGQPLPCAAPAEFHGGAGSLAIHGRITGSFDRPRHLPDPKQLRLLFDDTRLTWNIDSKLIGGFDLRPAQTPSQTLSPDGKPPQSP